MKTHRTNNLTTTKHYYAKYLKPLVGGKIIQTIVDVDNEDSFSEPYLGFIVKKGKKSFQVIALRDPEGNGAGHIEIVDITNLGSTTPCSTEDKGKKDEK